MHFKKEKKSKLSQPTYSWVVQQQFDRFPSKLMLYSCADECLEKYEEEGGREGGRQMDERSLWVTPQVMHFLALLDTHRAS